MKPFLSLLVGCFLLSLATSGNAKERKPNEIEEWLFQLAIKAAPPKYAWRPPSGPHAKETPEEREARYREIVYDIYRVVFYEGNRPLYGMNRTRTAGFLLGMAVGESSLAPDADLGPCYIPHPGYLRCDGGRAVGILQVWIPNGPAYTKKERAKLQAPYWKHRWKLITLGLKRINRSLRSCHNLPEEERLVVYGAGHCESVYGRQMSRKRWKMIKKIMSRAAPPHWKVAQKLIIPVEKKAPEALAKKKAPKGPEKKEARKPTKVAAK